jgi:hypothetical protein
MNELEKMMTEIQALSDDEVRTLDVSAAQRLCGRLDKFLHSLQGELLAADNELGDAEVNLAKAKVERVSAKARHERVKHLINLTVERMRNVKAFVSNSY